MKSLALLIINLGHNNITDLGAITLIESVNKLDDNIEGAINLANNKVGA